MLKETGETLCETRRKVRENEGSNLGNCPLSGFLRHLITSFQAASYINGTTREDRGISIVIPPHFFLVKPSEISARSKLTEALDVYVSTWIYVAICLIYSDKTEFIFQQFFNELIGGNSACP